MPFDPAAAASRVMDALGSPAGTELRDVGLLGLPTGAVLEMDEYLCELMRELQIIGSVSPPDAIDDALSLVQLLLGLFDPVRQTVRDAAAHAYDAGLPSFDLQLALPVAGVEAARAMRSAFDEVQLMCDAGELLSLPAGADLNGFFGWFLGAFAALSPSARYDGPPLGAGALAPMPVHPSDAAGRADRSAARTRSFPPVARSVRAVRSWVLEVLGGSSGPRERCELAVSEVASNAVLHACTALTVETASDGTTWYVGVKDHSPVVPTARSHARDATSGRGLQLLEAIVDRWGTRVEPDGKVVWFELDLAPACP